jgi:hypothetical protein
MIQTIEGMGYKPTVAIAHADHAGGAMDNIDTWAVELIDYAEKLGYNIVDICGSDLTYDRLPEILAQTKPAILFNFSHGRKTCLLGNPVDGMIKCTLTQGNGLPSNLRAMSGIAVVSYSSYTAGQLGEMMIKSGCPALAGFSEYLIIVSSDTDPYLFQWCLLPLSKSILDGFSVGEAVAGARKAMSITIKQYKAIKHIAVPLLYDCKSLTLLGDPDWRLIL